MLQRWMNSMKYKARLNSSDDGPKAIAQQQHSEQAIKSDGMRFFKSVECDVELEANACNLPVRPNFSFEKYCSLVE